MVSRSEGYRRAAGKEALALGCLRQLLQAKVGASGQEIAGYENNYRYGDLRFATGRTIECKGQPIDPDRYPNNFVEVFELTANSEHEGGLERLASLLSMSMQELQQASVRFRGSKSSVGNPKLVSVSITSIASSAFTAYVNYSSGGRHIYLYERDEIVQHIRRASRRGFVRGAGNSNEDTFAVFVPIAEMRWKRSVTAWDWSGDGAEADAVGRLRTVLLEGES